MRARPAHRAARRDGRTAQPLYARALRLRHIHPSGALCFLFFEGALAVAAVLALTELVSWWTLVILPAAVAVMVKLNDLIAGAAGYPEARPPAGRAVRW